MSAWRDWAANGATRCAGDTCFRNCMGGGTRWRRLRREYRRETMPVQHGEPENVIICFAKEALDAARSRFTAMTYCVRPLQPTPEGCYVSGAPLQRKRNADAGCYLQTRGKLRGEPTWGTRLSPARGVARTRASDAPSAPSYKEKERISYVESCVPAKSLFRPERGIAFLNFYAAHRMPASIESIIQNRWIPSAWGTESQTFVR